MVTKSINLETEKRHKILTRLAKKEVEKIKETINDSWMWYVDEVKYSDFVDEYRYVDGDSSTLMVTIKAKNEYYDKPFMILKFEVCAWDNEPQHEITFDWIDVFSQDNYGDFGHGLTDIWKVAIHGLTSSEEDFNV